MGELRITGGKYVRRRIKVPKGEIRPAMDRMRISIFAVLGDLTERSFLDLYSGSGVIGIEAASRGAAPVVLVERDPGKRATILANITFVETPIRLVVKAAERFVAETADRFDTIFLDPPFRLERKEALIERIEARGLLSEGGVLLIHHPEEESLPTEVGELRCIDRRRYGRSIVLFYRRE